MITGKEEEGGGGEGKGGEGGEGEEGKEERLHESQNLTLMKETKILAMCKADWKARKLCFRMKDKEVCSVT